MTIEPMYISVPEAARITGLTRGLIRSIVEQGLVPAIKVGTDKRYAYRINRAEFLKYLDKAEKKTENIVRYHLEELEE